MPRWSLIVLLALAVICAGIGTSLTAAVTPYGAASFGWTAYAPLSKTVYSGSYTPINTTWLLWAPRLGVALLALGAGTTGAIAAALLTEHKRRSATTLHAQTD
jgi:heme/copper-type cytochrome/quinol oxidase subunit 1